MLKTITLPNHFISLRTPSSWPRALAWCLSAALFTSSGLQAQGREDYCGGKPPRGFDQPLAQAHTGHYINATYGYSLTIPAGLTAFTSASGPERGFIIALGTAPRLFLSVDASYDAFYDISAAGVHQRDLNSIRMHDAVLDDQAAEVELAHVAGGRYRMHLQCRGGAGPELHEEVIVVRNREIYRLDLQSTDQSYDRDVQQLNAMIKSWRWEALR